MFKRIYRSETSKKLKSGLGLLVPGTLVFVLCFFTLGLYEFSSRATIEANFNSLPKADGIVVLTGEGSRIHSAVKLLEARQGKRLLISGVSREVSDKTVYTVFADKKAERYCCIDLDRLSLDTRGNAEHTAEWIDLHDYKRIIVVTSSYHMPRSLELLRNQMPSVEFIPAQIIPDDLKGNTTLGMMLSPKILIEYSKLLVTKLHLEPVAKYVWSSLEFSPKG